MFDSCAMANQFDARLIWHRREIWTVDDITGASAVIRDMNDGSDRPFKWAIATHGGTQTGRSKTEQGARNSVRLRISKLPSKDPS